MKANMNMNDTIMTCMMKTGWPQDSILAGLRVRVDCLVINGGALRQVERKWLHVFCASIKQTLGHDGESLVLVKGKLFMCIVGVCICMHPIRAGADSESVREGWAGQWAWACMRRAAGSVHRAIRYDTAPLLIPQSACH